MSMSRHSDSKKPAYIV
uniref:Uncharacterized protein n=1 Tax=Arundo donax TaxID=35708 RepID=A0A0A9F843_ARUDO